jgi:hypothetical protein
MRYLKEIVPYNRYWGNCITNMFQTILTGRDSSYEPLIYLNDYTYIYEIDDLFHLDYTREYYRYFKDNHFYFNNCNFAKKENFFEEFKDILINSPYVTLNVDLFYWNRDASYYNKIHSSHFSFIIGFDEEEGIIYAIEDDVSLNYLIRKIPVENLYISFLSEYKDDREDYRIISFKNSELKPYILEINHVISNAKKIICNLETFIETKSIFDKKILIENISNVHHHAYEFSKIANRFLGNALLFEALSKKKLLGEMPADRLIEYARVMSGKWEILRSLFLKYCKSNRISDVDQIGIKAAELFMKEKEMWLDFLNQYK